VGPSRARKRRKAIEKHSRLRDDLSRRCGSDFWAELDSIRAKIALKLSRFTQIVQIKRTNAHRLMVSS